MLAVLLGALSLGQVSYTKNDIKRAYQEGKCCLSTYPASLATLCLAELDGEVIGGHVLREHYTSQDCCYNDECTVSLDDCELCQTTATDLSKHLIGVEQSYYLNGILLSTIKHYETEIVWTMPEPDVTYFGFDDNTVVKYPTEEDPSYVMRTPTQSDEKTLTAFKNVGAVGLQSVYVADYVPTSKACTDMTAKYVLNFDNAENAVSFSKILESLTQLKVGEGVLEVFPDQHVVTMLTEVRSVC